MRKYNQHISFFSLLLGRVGVGLMVTCFSACGVTTSAPLDDAYYWPDKKSYVPDTTDVTDTTLNTIEYLDVQDTVVTVRIKK